MEPIIAKKNMKKDLLVIFGGLAFAAIGFLLLKNSDDSGNIIGIVSVAFFGVLSLVMAYIDIKTYKKAQVIINDDSVSYITMKGYKDVKFSDVKFYYIHDGNVIQFYDEAPKNVFNPGIGGFPLTNLDIPAKELAEILAERLKKHGAKLLQ